MRNLQFQLRNLRERYRAWSYWAFDPTLGRPFIKKFVKWVIPVSLPFIGIGLFMAVANFQYVLGVIRLLLTCTVPVGIIIATVIFMRRWIRKIRYQAQVARFHEKIMIFTVVDK